MGPLAIYEAVRFLLEQQQEHFHEEKRERAAELLKDVDQEYMKMLGDDRPVAADNRASADEADDQGASGLGMRAGDPEADSGGPGGQGAGARDSGSAA